MQFPIRIGKYLIWAISIILTSSVFVSAGLSSSRSSECLLSCKKTSQASNSSSFTPNLFKVMDALAGDIKENHFASSFIKSPPPEVYSIAQCHRDLTKRDCNSCFGSLRAKVPHCLPGVAGRIFLDGCFLRYDNYNFFHESTDPHSDAAICSSQYLDDELLIQQFETKVNGVIMNVTDQAKNNGGFAAVEGKGGIAAVYALAQCWETVGKEGCSKCLDSAKQRLKECRNRADGRAMLAGCYVRFSKERFFTTIVEPTDNGSNNQITFVIIAGVTSFAVLSCVGAVIGYKRLSDRRKGKNLFGDASKWSKLHFKYEILETATNFFDNSRKLGQGGAGSVFRGILPDGRNVAVKRLFFNTQQWVDQFFNEVNLITEIQHQNIVRLLGCCLEGPESLLVYEYVPNRSLDQILFVKNTIHILSWQQRLAIIRGIAEGLAYLHGGSRIKIVHRDIKTSNILLDEKLTPKIADFGLARYVSPDKSHVSTGIAGTLGYMAPEYLVRGQLTEKADVYAFGVLVIEVASGRKNSAFSEGSSSVLHIVWKHYKTERITHSVDPGLSGKFPENEAARVLQIGLLCTQASVAIRPSMSEVVHMLNNTDCAIPSPKQPPFLNSSILSPNEASRVSSFSSIKSFLTSSTKINCSSSLRPLS